MSMPQDAINAILNGSPSPLHFWVMNESAAGFTNFADKVSTGNLPLTIGSGVTPAGWGTITGGRGIGGPQTQAPSFSGSSTSYAQANGPILGGRPLGWGIIMWMDSVPNPTLDNMVFYCERGSSGNDHIKWYINSNSSSMILSYCDDTSGHAQSVNPTFSEVQISGGGTLLGVSVAANGAVSFFHNGPYGVGSSGTLNTSNTWTNPGLNTYIGYDPNSPANSFQGTLSWAAVFGSPFTAQQFNAWYQALTPVPTGGAAWSREVGGAVYPNSDFWNTPLDTLYPNGTPLDPNSSNIINQWTSYNSKNNTSPSVAEAIPMFNLDHTGRLEGNLKTGFLAIQDQHNFLLSVPMPNNFLTESPYPANMGSDAMAWVCQPSTGLQYDVYQGITASNSAATPSALFPPYLNNVTASTSSGTLTAGAYYYCITAVNSNGESFATSGFSQTKSATLSATGQITLAILADLNGVPPPTSWNIYRRGPYPAGGPYGSNADYGLLTSITNLSQGAGNTFVDNGSYGATNTAQQPTILAAADSTHPHGYVGTALTADWSSVGGGGSWDYLKNAAFNPCFKPSGSPANGASGTSCPDGGGVITLEEALNGNIPHPIAVAMPKANNSIAVAGHQWPAPRHDGTYSGSGYPIYEGMRLRFPSSLDPSSITYNSYAPLGTFQKAIVTAIRDYGLIVRDSTPGGMYIYMENVTQTGRNGWTYVFGGYSQGGSPSSPSVLGPVPWSSLEVLMPQRIPSRADSQARRTNRLDAPGNPTPVPY